MRSCMRDYIIRSFPHAAHPRRGDRGAADERGAEELAEEGEAPALVPGGGGGGGASVRIFSRLYGGAMAVL
jgi:hypothetical protein